MSTSIGKKTAKYQTVDMRKIDMKRKDLIFTDDMAFSSFVHVNSIASESNAKLKTKSVTSTRKINTSTHPKFH